MNIRRARVLHNRSIHSHNRAVCPLAVLLAVGLCCMVAAGDPWLETTIDLSACRGVEKPRCLAFCSRESSVWVAGQTPTSVGSGCVAVAIDGATLSPIAKAYVSADVVQSLCYVAPENKLYTADVGWDLSGRTLTVIDCSTRTAVSSVQVSYNPFRLCYNSVSNKLYCLTTSNPDLHVVDCSSDSVVAQPPTGPYSPTDIVWASATNEVYVANGGNIGNWDTTVTVVDGVTDDVVATIPVGRLPSVLCYNSVEGKVYCASTGGRIPDPIVSVINCYSHEVTARIAIPEGLSAMCYNSNGNKIYCATTNSTDTSLVVIDGSADTVLGAPRPFSAVSRSTYYDPSRDRLYFCNTDADRIVVVDGTADTVVCLIEAGHRPFVLCYDTTRKALFCGNDDATVTVVDCRGDSLLSTIFVGLNNPAALCYSESLNLLYSAEVANAADRHSQVSVVDGAANLVLAQTPVGIQAAALLLNAQRGKLYCACYLSDSVFVLDAATGQVTRAIQVGNAPRALCYDSLHDKIYCANDSSGDVSVIACASDSVVATVPAGNGPRALLFNAFDNKVYCANERGNSLTVLDCNGDTAVATVPGVGQPVALCLNPARNKLYCADYGGGYVNAIDCAADTVVARLRVGAYAQDVCYGPSRDEVYCGVGAYSAGHVNVVECSHDSLVATVDAQDPVRALLFDSENNRLLFSTSGGWPSIGKAAAIDVAQRRAWFSPRLGRGPRSLAWNPQQNRLYVANEVSGSISVVRIDSLAVAECPDAGSIRRDDAPTIVRGVLCLPLASSVEREASSVLLDVSGRKVMDLKPGANDVRALAPGVYFVREAHAQAQAIQKVVITR